MPVKTITTGVVGAISLGLAGWIGVTSVSSIVAPQGDFLHLAEVSRVARANATADVPKKQAAFTASAAEQLGGAYATPQNQKVASARIISVDDTVGSASTSATTTLPVAALPDEIKKCTYQTTQFPNYNRLILNEVAWMGTKTDSSGEWIELKNISEEPLELEGYQIIDKAEQIKITLQKKTLAPGGLYLLERGEEDEHALPADVVYTGALSNSNEGLRLYDKHCFLVDQVEALPKWPAGESTSKKSMERGGGMYWYTFSGSAVEGIFGTPGMNNRAPTSTAVAQPTVLAVAPEPAGLPVTTTDDSSGVTIPEEPAVTYATKLVISKIQITGGPGKATEDFVEFYNPGPGQFNLKGYRLVKRTKTGTSDTSLKSWTADAFINEGGVYRWANTTYPGSADIRTSGSIANDNAVALRKGGEDVGEIVDGVGWGEAANALVEGSVFPTNPLVSQILNRKNNQDTDNNSLDFEVQ